jgi:hypothetical protein
VNITQKCGDQNVGGLGHVERFLRSTSYTNTFSFVAFKEKRNKIIIKYGTKWMDFVHLFFPMKKIIKKCGTKLHTTLPPIP